MVNLAFIFCISGPNAQYSDVRVRMSGSGTDSKLEMIHHCFARFGRTPCYS